MGEGREAVGTAGPGVDYAAAARTLFYHLLLCPFILFLLFSFFVFVLVSIFASV